MRRVVSLLLTGLVAGAVVLGTAAPAFAHNVLVSSDPKDGSRLEAGPAAITLTFDQAVQAGEKFNTITVTGPEGTRWEAAGEPTVKNNSVVFPVRPLGPAAEYTVGYRILSADGHPVTGSLKFTLTKAGSGTPAPAAESAAQDPASTSSGAGGVPIWVWIVGAAVLLAGGAFLALRGGADSAKESTRR
ncbi:copper resistance protein CopC [Saccharothrix sp. NRRL B-16348]|uniref:copper resistance CopC family protein n=1 Tax=Saccharothrix sp. NRRL B-16348 TaxID=1415542 RepID=UPI0006AE2BB4|nr:copper resistance CopC family protein [Saccharothrix sp. NRRL B-16348]KOX35235.1 copper resistance protein CopC [Saccharothrix sp. NRRL B-16348]